MFFVRISREDMPWISVFFHFFLQIGDFHQFAARKSQFPTSPNFQIVFVHIPQWFKIIFHSFFVKFSSLCSVFAAMNTSRITKYQKMLEKCLKNYQKKLNCWLKIPTAGHQSGAGTAWDLGTAWALLYWVAIIPTLWRQPVISVSAAGISLYKVLTRKTTKMLSISMKIYAFT